MEVRTLLKELARVWEKDIDEDYDIDLEILNKYFIRWFNF